jgi:hypothetical protein
MSNLKEIKEKVKIIIKQIAGSLDEDDELLPEIAIKSADKNYLYCYQPYERTFTKVIRGQKAFIIDDTLDDRERILIYTLTGKIVRIDKDEILHTGYD